MSRNSDANSARDENPQHGIDLAESNNSGSNDSEQQISNDEIKENAIESGDDEKSTVIASPIAAYEGTDVPAPDKPIVPTDDRRYIKFGLLFLLITLGGFSAWAGFAPLGSALISSGEVVVNSYRKSIQHYEGGIVERIFVKNGDKVAAGDPLVELDAIQSEAQQFSNQKRLLTTQAELERLVAEQNFETSLVFSDVLLDHAKQDSDIHNALMQQQQLHSARLKAFMQEQDALGTRIEQTRQQITGLGQQSAIVKEQIVSLQKEQAAFSTLFDEGLGDGQRARELDRSVLSTQNEVARIESEISRLKIQISETELQIATRKQDFLKDVGERIRQAQGNYYNYQEALKIASDRIDRSIIRSPEAGVVVGMQVHTIGSVAASGQTLLDLVPERDTFVVETQLNTQDINEVYVGQKADIRFSAFNANMTKVIEGVVINVSADRLLSERDNTPYYLARIQISEQGAKDMGEDMVLKPGMPAEVMILRDDRTLFSYLIKPIADSLARSLKEE